MSLSPAVSTRVAEVRKAWKNDDKRKVCDPLAFVVSALVKTNIKEMGDCKTKAERLTDAKQRLDKAISDYESSHNDFMESFYNARRLMSWLYRDAALEAGLSPRDVEEALHKDPESLCNAIHQSSCEVITRAILRGKNYTCVLCGAKQ